MLHLPRKHSCRPISPAPKFRSPAGVLSFVGLILCAIALPVQAQESGRVTAVRYWSLGDGTRIAIETDGDFHFRSDRLENPDRLFFDVVGAKPAVGHKGVNVIPVSDRFVRQIRVAETQKSVTRVVLDLESAVEFTTSRLENPQRLIIEVHPVGYAAGTLKSAPAPISVDPIVVERRTFRPPVPAKPARYQAEVALLDAPLFDISPAMPPAPLNLVPRISQPAPVRSTRAPVVLAKTTSPITVMTPAAPSSTPSPVSVSAPPARPVSPDSAVPARRNSTGDRSMVRVLGLKVGRIVLDAGHGGHDTGTIGPEGLKEKDLVLDVAKRLGALIEQRLGSEVIYTRSDDTFIPLEHRTEIANEAKADLFLSIHANSSPLRTAAGVETYYLSFTTSKAALDVAARENASSQKSIYELQDLLQKIALKDKVDESREFAARVQDSLYSTSAKTNARARDRGVRKAPFVVLIGASMPSVLAEIGFVSNAHDENLMKRPEHRQRIAEALYKGLSSYASTLSHFQMAQRRP
jgi:N-acetylmuramoyl-L-alanine amidase